MRISPLASSPPSAMPVAASLSPDEYARQAEALRPRLTNVARGVLGGAPDVDDVVQEAILQGLRALASFRADASLSTWMHRIVVNAALMQLRRRRRRPEHPFDELVEILSAAPQRDARGTPEHDLLAQEDLVRLQRALDEQSDEALEIVTLCCVEERSMREAADCLGISVGAVKSRLFRARQRLRQAITEPAPARVGGAASLSARDAAPGAPGAAHRHRTRPRLRAREPAARPPR